MTPRHLAPALTLVALLGCADHTHSPTDAGTVDIAALPLEELVTYTVDTADVPSVAAALVDHTGVTSIAAAGVRRAGDAVPVTVDDQYHLGSNTKAMTAALAATAVDEGALSWTSTLGEVLGGELTELDEGYLDVTLVELLSHTAGIDDATVIPLIEALDDDPSTARRESLGVVLAVPPQGPRGTFRYSNVGYVAAGRMLEVALGDSWERLLTARLFEPLQMRSCGFGPPGEPGVVDQPWGHEVLGRRLRPIDPGADGADNAPVLGPAGTVHCALGDWARFAAMMLRGLEGSTDELVSAAGFAELRAPRSEDGYALGWVAREDPIQLVHDGSNTHFYSLAILTPGTDEALLVATNVGSPRAEAALELVLTWYAARQAESE
ncbi:MAG: serine hydrolase domain-containing protein [Polyangiales bacterium]